MVGFALSSRQALVKSGLVFRAKLAPREQKRGLIVIETLSKRV